MAWNPGGRAGAGVVAYIWLTFRWLFIIEGCITVFAGFLAIIILPDYPKT